MTDTPNTLEESPKGSAYKELIIASVADFVRYIESRNDRGVNLIFRGQSRAYWDLVPSIFRTLNETRVKSPHKITIQDAEHVARKEMAMLKDFQAQAVPHLDRVPALSDKWEWLALARHYDLPTRLLDWTEHGATALFFSVSKEDNRNNDSAVWCSELPNEIPANDAVDPFTIKDIYFYKPPHIAPRIIAQRACFTVHPTNYLVSYMPWIHRNLVKLVVPSSHRTDIRRSLRTLGIHNATLFPDLDGIVKEIKRRHRLAEYPPSDHTHRPL